MELIFRKPAEIVSWLSTRLRQERLAQQMPQAEVAARAGISANTLSNLEAGRNVGLVSLVRVAMVLGRGKELEELFKPRLESLEDMVRYEEGASRQRVRKKSRGAGRA